MTEHPVFRLKLNGENTVVCQYKGMLREDQELLDEEIGDPAYYINSVVEKNGENNIFVRYYKCNVLGGYLLKEDKIPLYYTHVNFTRGIVSGFLFNLWIFFIPDEETKKSIKHPNNYVNKTMTGKFVMQLILDGNVADEENNGMYTKEVENYYQQFYADELKKELESRGLAVDEDTVKTIARRRAHKKIEWLTGIHPVEYMPTVNRAIREMRKFLLEGDTYQVLVNAGLDVREKERCVKWDSGNLFESRPDVDRVIDLGYLKNNPDKINEYLDNRKNSA